MIRLVAGLLLVVAAGIAPAQSARLHEPADVAKLPAFPNTAE